MTEAAPALTGITSAEERKRRKRSHQEARARWETCCEELRSLWPSFNSSQNIVETASEKAE